MHQSSLTRCSARWFCCLIIFLLVKDIIKKPFNHIFTKIIIVVVCHRQVIMKCSLNVVLYVFCKIYITYWTTVFYYYTFIWHFSPCIKNNVTLNTSRKSRMPSNRNIYITYINAIWFYSQNTYVMTCFVCLLKNSITI